MSSIQKEEIHSLLKTVLSEEDLIDFSLDILGNSEKGSGYLGDLLFVHLCGRKRDQSFKEYNLVLKCAKKNQTLRDSVAIKEIFECEIYIYQQVLPAFTEFQLEKKFGTIFDSFPKCYGASVSDDMEILVLENLKIMGYTLCDVKKPLTFNNIEFVMKEYGKFHAISAAMQDQCSKKFTQLTSGIDNIWKKILLKMNTTKLFSLNIDHVCELIKDDVDPVVIKKLKNLQSQISYVLRELIHDRRHFSVINHGDGWSNNFMFKFEGSNAENPIKMAILDWQISRYTNPVVDLSYFIYCCISKEDLDNFDKILKLYYDSFSNFMEKLGSNADKVYFYSQFLKDWKIFAKSGIIKAFLMIKIALTDNDEVSDFSETIEKGCDVSETFSYKIKDDIELRRRYLYLIDHIMERNLI